MEPDQNHSRKDGNTVETKDYIFAQAANGHVQVISKKAKGMVLHMSCTAMFSTEKLQAFADRFQAANSRSIDSMIEAMTALA